MDTFLNDAQNEPVYSQGLMNWLGKQKLTEKGIERLEEFGPLYFAVMYLEKCFSLPAFSELERG